MRKKRSTFQGSTRGRNVNVLWRSRNSKQYQARTDKPVSIWPPAKCKARAAVWTGARADG